MKRRKPHEENPTLLESGLGYSTTTEDIEGGREYGSRASTVDLEASHAEARS